MKKKIHLLMVFCFYSCYLVCQNNITGKVQDAETEAPLADVIVEVKAIGYKTKTDSFGKFILKKLPKGIYAIHIFKKGYTALNYSVELENMPIDLGVLFLYPEEINHFELGTITLSDDELDNDISSSDNITGLLQSSRNTFLRTAAFDFSNSFFKIRGLDSKYGKVLINGLEMNKPFNGRPLWSTWGGLNHLTNNQEFQFGLSPSSYNFGGLLGTTNINLRASELRKSSAISYANSNRSYTHRFMATHVTELKNNWHIAFSLGTRIGAEGYIDGTFYKSYSFLASIEKELNDNHSLSLISIVTPNRRGRSTAITDEIFQLKDHQYNPFWGNFNGKKRNSRYREIFQPILMFQHHWRNSEKMKFTNTLSYQFGHIASSRIDYNGTDLNPLTGFPEGGGNNPDPSYYQKLPSYAVRNYPEDLSIAYGLLKSFTNDGQIDWNEMIYANLENKLLNNGNSIYVQYEDKTKDHLITVNSLLNNTINEETRFTAGINLSNLQSNNFAQVVDLLGGKGYLDVNSFNNDYQNSFNQDQNNVLNPNNIVQEKEPFKYHYSLSLNTISAFSQIEINKPSFDYFLAAKIHSSSLQRDGKFKNGRYINSSFGKSEKHQFIGGSIKAGGVYRLTGRHIFQLQTAFLSDTPTIQNTFINPREHEGIIPNLKNEKSFSISGNYTARLTKLQATFSSYYISQKNINEVSYFFADGIGGDNSAFIQEILQGAEKQYIGLELGLEYQLSSELIIKGVAAMGQHHYTNIPNLYIGSDQFLENDINNFGVQYLGNTYLNNYFLSSGPQRAFSLGFEYRDPDFWWIGATANHLSKSYIDISPIRRSDNFYKDNDDLPFSDYNLETAKELLKQEKLPSHLLINLVGGKSWKINNYYLSLFGSVSNLLNKVYKTGGFEQGRNANYRSLLEDSSLETPVFGNKYWFGRGTTYFINLTLRF